MTAKIISGTQLRASIIEELKIETKALVKKYNRPPGLVTILVGNNPASISYVNLKIKTAENIGFKEVQENLPDNASEEKLLEMISKYNNDDTIDGILVQLPLPSHINEEKIIYAIDPDKDVDGFHPVNVGRLVIGKKNLFPPCTPAGIVEMLKRAGVSTQGAEVVVVGRSNIVGKPVANMLLQKGEYTNSTVTVVHTGSRDLKSHCLRADILIVAAGVPGLVKPEWIKKGACVIDVGVNRVGEKISSETGRKISLLKGDVEFDEVKKIAGYITPVPGGVGPMTIAMLMKNTVTSMKHRMDIDF
ncbi:MAG: bifunctional 5,10-methylene-tetrahydrofolate dehydrogenase/5,10-methylene-tetrahydrofolate cyclohydrolase [Deltaproteobacteria bacterium]|nr:MAG: bifunctional 5,10-methylene-tetrahydrofolate dehydrogenase/5,10-methylene-tetrahydrofolate cyclohydrolase [Deltaproteobacteria bacterium]